MTAAPPGDQPSHRLEFPPLGARYLLPVDDAQLGDYEPPIAQRFEASTDGLAIDGALVPWQLYRVPIQVDDVGGGLHVVYLPVLIEGAVVAGLGVREATLGELLGEQDGPGGEGAQG